MPILYTDVWVDVSASAEGSVSCVDADDRRLVSGEFNALSQNAFPGN